MKINRIGIQGFKSICNQTVNLAPINILIGGNGIGKTNFISALELIRNIYDRQLQKYVIEHGGAGSLLHLGRKVTSDIGLDIEIESKEKNRNRYIVNLSESQDTLYISKTKTAFFNGVWHYQDCDANVLEATISTDRMGQAYYVGPLLNQFRVYHFHDTGAASPIKGVKPLNDNRFLYSDGSNIAPFLYYVKLTHPDVFDLIEKTIASVTPFFKAFYLEPDRINPEMIRLGWFHTMGGEQLFNDWQLSDGTLRFICLTALLLQPVPPDVIIIDEPELGLHPQAINKLSSMIKRASKKSQIIISTQSVGLVDNFAPEDIIVVDKQNASSVYRRLNSNELSQWLTEYSLGEIWEMNVFGGQPL